MKTPNSKTETPEKFQAPKSRLHLLDGNLELDVVPRELLDSRPEGGYLQRVDRT